MSNAATMSATKLALAGRSLWNQEGQLRVAEPVAIIGMGCRFAGGVNDPESLWRLLLAGADVVGEVPADRWDNAAWYDPDPATPGKVSTRWGGFLDDIRGFDAAFFDISPREAERMDPQQRIALEVACEAVERAGIPLSELRGSATGVFFSSYHNDYTLLQYTDLKSVTGRTLTGTLHSVIPNRISYALGLRGPSMTIDSACSSSLVGVHLACQALRSRDCEMALVGGVNVMITPHVTVALSRGGFMSPTGRCWTFDAGADGFVRSEGCGVVVLKRLSDAIAAGDPVLAVIRGSAVNQDGESTTISAPNGLAQAEMIRTALRNAGLEPDDIALLEAHGTGTQLGDPIETDALAAVFGARAPDRGPVWLGSLKSNLGHMEAAAGVGGLIKAVLCLRHGTVPPHALFSTLNPHVELEGTPLRIAREATPMDGPRPLRAGVSSFGVGGTNAHVIVEAPPAGLEAPPIPTAPPFLLPLSARSAAALRGLAGRYAERIRGGADAGAVSRAAARRRTHHAEFRAGLVAPTAEALLSELDAIAAGTHVANATPLPVAPPPLCFVFTGQGVQWPGMALALRDAEPIFRAELERVDAAFAAAGGLRPVDELERSATESRLERTDVAQVTVFAIQVALTRLLALRGTRPAIVIGHSVGELAAAVAAGLMTLDEGVQAVLARGAAMQTAFDTGRMVAVRLSEADAEEFLSRHGLDLAVAAVNGPESVVLSGPTDEVETACHLLTEAGVRHTRLDVRFAFHSPLMAEAAEGLRGAPQPAASDPGEVTFVSTVTGHELTHLDDGYLAANVRSPVRFHTAVERALELGVRHFVEIGPHPALGGAVTESAEAAGVQVHTAYCQHRDRDARGALVALTGRLYDWGCTVDWKAVYPGACPPVELPTYAWDHRPYWLPGVNAGAIVPSALDGTAVVGERSFPGRPLRSPALDRPVFELDARDPVLDAFRDHRVGPDARVPATGLLELLRSAALAAGVERPEVKAVGILRPVELDSIRRLQVVLSPGGVGRADIVLETAAGEWVTTVSAELTSGQDQTATAAEALAFGVESTDAPEFPVDRLYTGLEEAGLAFGPGYRLLNALRASVTCAEGTIAVDRAPTWSGEVNPAVLDAATQLCIATLAKAQPESEGRTMLPWAVDGYHVLRSGAAAGACAVLRKADADGAAFDVFLLDDAGAPLVWLEGWRLRPTVVAPVVLRESVWEPSEVGPRTMDAGRWLVIDDTTGVGGRVAEALEKAGHTAVRLEVGREADLDDVLAAEPWHGVVHCGALGAASLDVRGERLLEVASAVCEPLLAVARASAKGGLGGLRLLVVSRGAQPTGAAGEPGVPVDGAVLGLTRAVRAEATDIRCTALDLDPVGSADPADEVAQILDEALAERTDAEVAVRDGVRLVHRTSLGDLRTLNDTGAGGVVLVHERTGTLDGFTLREQAQPAAGPGEVTLRVLAAGLNFRDVLTVLGSYRGAPEIGHECCGEVVAVGSDAGPFRVGDRVIAFWPGCFANFVTVPVGFVAPAPAGMSPAAAATLPVAYGTAWYGLYELGALQAGQSVLIHAGAGGVGQAAIRLALARGARVFATASTPEKRAWLESQGVEGAFDSRSTGFADAVLEATGGEGVDLVLNSLIGPLLTAGLRCVRPGGLFIELGKREVLEPSEVEAIRPDVRYAAFDLKDVAKADPALLPRLFGELNAALAAGDLAPLRVTVLPLQESESGFRRMARAQHIGKIVFVPPPAGSALGEGWVVLTGGTGGLGRATLQWVLERGARRVAVWSRGGAAPDLAHEIEALRERYGAEIVTARVDVSREEEVTAELDRLRAVGSPITAVVHVAGVLDDGTLAQVSPDRLEAVLRPKLAGAWNLHRATLGDPVAAFVLYSAVGPLVDAAGQGSYAAANAFLDALAVHRRGMGLPAVSVRWGLFRDGGMAARLTEAQQQRWLRKGLGWLDRNSGGAAFEAALTAPGPQVFAIQLERPAATAEPAGTASQNGAGSELTERLRTLPLHLRMPAALEYVLGCVSAMLGLSAPPDADAPLRDLGLDSLSAIELRNALTVAIGEALPATLAFDYPTAAAISRFLLERLGLHGPTPAADEIPNESRGARDEIDALSDEEAEALLLAELADLPSEVK